MAVGAVLGRADAARGVREMRIERLAAVAFRRNRLLLRVNPFAIRILRADHDRARRADHCHAIFLHRPVDAEHENVVAHDLRIVGGEIAVGHAFEFVLRHALVRFHRQMTTETTRRPRGVTDLAIHRAVIVRESRGNVVLAGRWLRNSAAPCFAIAPQCLGVGRLRIVVRRQRIDRVDRLRNFPAHVGRHDRLLIKLGRLPKRSAAPMACCCCSANRFDRRCRT